MFVITLGSHLKPDSIFCVDSSHVIPCTEHLPTIPAVMTSLNEFEFDSAARAKVGKFILDPVISHTTYSKTYKYNIIHELTLHTRHEFTFQPFWESVKIF